MTDIKEPNAWYAKTQLGMFCSNNTHCESCPPNGDCEICDTIDGRWMEAVNEYASTCDHCAELTSHDSMIRDVKTNLGYCELCIPILPKDIYDRLEINQVDENER